jgi:hypothetical protein
MTGPSPRIGLPFSFAVTAGQGQDPDAAAHREHTDRLRETVRSALALDEHVTVLVQELACAEKGCPPVETVVAVLTPGAGRRVWKLPSARRDIDAEALRTLVTHHPEGHDHDH